MKMTARVLAMLMLSGAMLTGTTALADTCGDRIHRAEVNLREAVRKHGEHSRQAEERRRQLEEVRGHCHR